MSRRLKVLISAYACEPHKGSEPEVGWQWSLQMARFHDVTVLTRSNNREVIEKELGLLRGRQPLPTFVYHEETPFLLEIKRSFRALKLYYLLWQRSAHERIAELHRAHHFDLMHHVTFAAFRYPSAIWGHGAPCVWGPIGGIESIPLRLLPWSHPKSLIREIARDSHNLIQSVPFHILPRRAQATTVTLASTPEMQNAFARLGFEVRLMPTIGLKTSELPYRPPQLRNEPLKLLFVGNIITLKGVDLALRALSESQTDATFTLVGDGDFLPAARELTRKLKIENRVEFRGRIPRGDVLKLYSEFDLFIFPSLHDTGGYAVIEAMFNALPVVCLDCGGPAVAVRENCGVKVPLGKRGEVIAGIASAIRLYDRDRKRLREHGDRAREHVLANYDWDKKGEQMNEVYQQAASRSVDEKSIGQKTKYLGIGSTTHMLHKMISFKGAAVALLALLLIGALGFFSLHQLKIEAGRIVHDTLPGLSYAGEANAYLADASRTLLFITTSDVDQRKKIHEEIIQLSDRTTEFLGKYSRSVFDETDRSYFEALNNTRKDYMKIRDAVLGLAVAGKTEKALKEYNQSLLPLQRQVKKAGDKLFEYNMRQGELRGERIMAICTATQIVVAVACVMVFLLGFFVGLFK
jgi:glycosyltransferase involved in cell wall biosynthesis